MGRRRPSIAAVIAGLVSAPLVALALIGAAYIAYSLLFESWYRSMFGAYGSKLLVLYVFFAVGVVTAALIALGYSQRHGRSARALLFVFSLVGVACAVLLEVQFWADADRLLPHGLLLLPFIGWTIAAVARHPAP